MSETWGKLGICGVGVAVVAGIIGLACSVSDREKKNRAEANRLREKEARNRRSLQKRKNQISRSIARNVRSEDAFNDSIRQDQVRYGRDMALRAYREQRDVVSDLQNKLDSANGRKESLKNKLAGMVYGTPAFEETRRTVHQLSQMIYNLVNLLKEARQEKQNRWNLYERMR